MTTTPDRSRPSTRNASRPWIDELEHPRPPLVVLSHLRWGFVFQRPQHLLSRLALDFDVYFVEEPVRADGEPHLVSSCPVPGVEVLVPHTPLESHGWADDQMAVVRTLLSDFLAERAVVEPFVWLYTPMALPLADDLEPAAVVYDCMDDLASFKHAPPQMKPREEALLQRADVVLTGGPSLYEARRDRHPNVHCLPSAVDIEHYAPSRLSTLAQAASPEASQARMLHATMPRPRLGFFGVIDERLDLQLVEQLADRRPDWQVVMVGPVAKIDPSTLPRRPNLHWLGMQTYEALPHLLAQWDVALLPFALNESTRFISPTKTLEYLAGEKPVVSTPVTDVVGLYGHVVRIAADADGFVQACEAALGESAGAREAQREAARATVRACTWDGTAAKIRGLLLQFLPQAARPQADDAVAVPAEHAATADAELLRAAAPATRSARPVGLSSAAPT